MKTATGSIVSFPAGSLSTKRVSVAMLRIGLRDGHRFTGDSYDGLSVCRPTQKQAIRAANRMAKKLGWEMKTPWRKD